MGGCKTKWTKGVVGVGVGMVDGEGGTSYVERDGQGQR